jgi:hypothetical protein
VNFITIGYEAQAQPSPPRSNAQSCAPHPITGFEWARIEGTDQNPTLIAVPKKTTKKKWTSNDTLALAKKWEPVFKAPPSTVMTIVDIESEHNPRKINMKREDRGGAWGLGQQMLDETSDKISRIVRDYGKKHPEVKKVAKKWNGDPEKLLDPELNTMITSWQLGTLHQKFKDFDTVVAAYHQGENAVSRRLAQGQPAVGPKQPLGMQYLARARAAHAKYAPKLYASNP